jgi:hypothetical protein
MKRGIITFALISSLLITGCVGSKAVIDNPQSSKQKLKDGILLSKVQLNLKFEGKDLPLSLPIYMELNRYYIPLSELIEKLGGTVSIDQEVATATVNNKQVLINLKTNQFSKDGTNYSKLKKKTIYKEQVLYIALQDFCKMYDLKTHWNVKDNVVALYWDRHKITPKNIPQNSRPALLRLEDVSASPLYATQDATEKLRVIADYLYSENIPYHIAWVPRYIDPRPQSKIDNDMTKQNSMLNADFLFTLDYMLDRNALLGLHGYTHQYGNSQSIIGVEFHTVKGDGIPATKQYARERFTHMCQNAETLDLSYSFFEAPHYAISQADLKLAEKYFDYIYEPYPSAPSKVFKSKVGKRVVKYIPTSLTYLNGKQDTPKMLSKIQDLSPEVLASLFYHPYIEFNDISLIQQPDGYPDYQYSETSVLHQLSKGFSEQGYKFISIKNL